MQTGVDRRPFLKSIGTAGMLSALPERAFARHGGASVLCEVAAPGFDADANLTEAVP